MSNEQMDAYDQAVEYLTEHPDEILGCWNYAFGPSPGKGACLFGSAARDPSNFDCGCLTMVRSGDDKAETRKLTNEIRNDDRIPCSGRGITVAHLTVFAEWQRRLDKELGRTPPALDPRLSSPAHPPESPQGTGEQW